MIIFGGNNLNDLWVLTNANGNEGDPAWLGPTVSGTKPGALFGHTAVYDETTNTMLIFGGGACCLNLPLSNRVWRLSNANAVGATPFWTQLTPEGNFPGSRGYHSAVYDRKTDRMIVFGGSGGNYNDVWVLEGAIPVPMLPPPPP